MGLELLLLFVFKVRGEEFFGLAKVILLLHLKYLTELIRPKAPKAPFLHWLGAFLSSCPCLDFE